MSRLCGVLALGLCCLGLCGIADARSAEAYPTRSVRWIVPFTPGGTTDILAGKLRALAVTTLERSPALPDLPTVNDTVPGFEVSAWFGMGVPRGTPAPVIDTLYRVINDALADPQIKAWLAELGVEPMNLNPAEFEAHIAAETAKLAKVVKLSGARVD